jgi:hypothetical protein
MEIEETSSETYEVLVQPGGTGPWDVLHEPYILGPWTQNVSLGPGVTADAVGQVLHIPAGDYFVMGDNRNESCDSRYFGLVPRKDILAKAILRIWPLGSFGGLGPGMTLTRAVSPPGRSAGLAASVPLAAPLLRRKRRRRSPTRTATTPTASLRP